MSWFCLQVFFSSPDTIVVSSSIGFSKAWQTLYGIDAEVSARFVTSVLMRWPLIFKEVVDFTAK